MTTIPPATTPGGPILRGQPGQAQPPVRGGRLAWRIVSVVVDAVLYVGLSIAIVAMPDAFKLPAAFGLALVIGRLFLKGHAACHGALFASRRANRVVGRLLFLPSYTAYRLWDLAHNRTHHAFARFRALDDMWRPMSPAKFCAAPTWRRALERVYRTIPGHGLYYFFEIYCPKLIVPSRRFVPERRMAYWRDTVAVGGFVALQLGFYVTAAAVTQQPVAWVIVTALVLPFALWNALAGSVTFLRHTHSEGAWFDDLEEWDAVQPQLRDTVRPRLDAFLDAVRRCKLYDYDAHRWLDFRGRITAEIPSGVRARAATRPDRSRPSPDRAAAIGGGA